LFVLFILSQDFKKVAISKSKINFIQMANTKTDHTFLHLIYPKHLRDGVMNNKIYFNEPAVLYTTTFHYIADAS